ncbi:MAG: bifunctional hydroxymethylpyrimidine kinase/phosphomethylpyrimidine kinase [Cyanobacteria bacterium]|nr:bifunctional hydroxymethylpyrimidine kinase/phosphomethylpyrimidine kinase [Cyanobacteriota bacterium]
MSQTMIQKLRQAIEKFHAGRVLVIGDLAIDEMIYGMTSRLSREAPVVILAHKKTDIILGAAGNAAHNIAKLQAKRVAIVGVAGKDYQCSLLLDALHRDGLDTSGLILDENRPTTTKTRISGIANQSVTQQLVRIDRESQALIPQEIENKLIDRLNSMAQDFDAILLSDYGLGVITPAVIETCHHLVKKHGLIYAVDSQKDLSLFQGSTILTPNQPEAENNVGYTIETQEQLLKAGETILSATQGQNLLITRGSEGMALFERQGSYSQIPVFNKSEVFDVTGAGDTVVGTLTLALATGTPILEAAILGNLAASIVVKRFGASTTTPLELTEALNAIDGSLIESIQTTAAVF